MKLVNNRTSEMSDASASIFPPDASMLCCPVLFLLDDIRLLFCDLHEDELVSDEFSGCCCCCLGLDPMVVGFVRPAKTGTDDASLVQLDCPDCSETTVDGRRIAVAEGFNGNGAEHIYVQLEITGLLLGV
uniref:Uncharacterized protein n=1 Tax=Romanomermis culicivorax TaxID=13658 RepID=A0A915IN08_ROMCU